MTTPLQKEAEYEAANRMAAEIILAESERYGFGMTLWAKMVLSTPASTALSFPHILQRTQYQGKQALLFPTNCRRR